MEEWVEEMREGEGEEIVRHPFRARPYGGNRKELTDRESTRCLPTTPPTVVQVLDSL